MTIRTRFAPSPTGYLHVGGARTALFSWAYARKHGGKFILRIEDTDQVRSTQESVNAILKGLEWLGIDWDEGPFYQMQRMDRYREAIQELLSSKQAYYCYCTPEELEIMRNEQIKSGLKPRYNGLWRDSTLPPPRNIPPVVRFKNPLTGAVLFNDLIKGKISVQNNELDDFIIARSDGTPTYNFCVVVDDWDMKITHVIRGDDHVNNTPRQINLLRALHAPIPEYAHVPMILANSGERLSKRHGAVSVTQYETEGYLPEAMLNFLARLSWGHGNDEIFSMSQFINWFDLSHVNSAPARFNFDKLKWLNQQYIKTADIHRLTKLVEPHLAALGINPMAGPSLPDVIHLLRDRATLLTDLAGAVRPFYLTMEPDPKDYSKYLTPDIQPIMKELYNKFQDIDWNSKAIHAAITETVTHHQVNFGRIAMPLRLLITGTTQTPSIDSTLELIGQAEALKRMKNRLATLPEWS
ncbi:MAG: glutamate--tRNA ligase [Proteobacteria bacterium]|nr:glutamate--tRNA ligase [Pseudomonadota bacterium]